MAASFGLHLSDGRVIVARQSAGQWRISEGSDLSVLAGRETVLFLDGLDVLGLTVQVPARRQSDTRKAAPFAVEDEIAQSVDDIHVALDTLPQGREGLAEVRADVISQAKIRHLMSDLDKHGQADAALVCAHSCLGEGDLLIDAGTLIVGQLGPRRFTLDGDVPSDVLAGLIKPYPDCAIYGGALARRLGRPSQGEGPEGARGLLIWLAEQYVSGRRGISLRQGSYQQKARLDLGDPLRWRGLAVLAALLGMGWFATVLLETHGLKEGRQQMDALSAEFANLGWPEAGSDVQRALALSASTSSKPGLGTPSALSLSALLYDGLGQVPCSELQSLRYDETRRSLFAVISFDDFGGADRLVSALGSLGVAASAGDARQSGNRVVSDVTLGDEA